MLLLFLVCIAPVSITVGMKDSFYWRISLFGLPFPVSLFMGKDKKAKKTKDDKKSKKHRISKKGKSEDKAAQASGKKTKRNAFGTVELVLELAKIVISDLPRSLRIRLCFLDITVGGKEAADVALNYGRFYALLEGALAFLYSYKGVLHGFFADRRKISLRTDYTLSETRAKFKMRISFFLWQLLFVAMRVGIRYIILTLRNGDETGSGALKEEKAS